LIAILALPAKAVAIVAGGHRNFCQSILGTFDFGGYRYDVESVLRVNEGGCGRIVQVGERLVDNL
jgi:hypothetical protein